MCRPNVEARICDEPNPHLGASSCTESVECTGSAGAWPGSGLRVGTVVMSKLSITDNKSS